LVVTRSDEHFGRDAAGRVVNVRWLAASGGLADLKTVFDPKMGAYRESSAENTDL
jgi:hypothetical protein